MIVQREEFMPSPHKNGEEIPNLRPSHFLKPTLPTNTPLPKPPSLTTSSKSHISLLKSIISFKKRHVPHKNWVIWVHTLVQKHQETWKKVGIFDAIISTTYKIKSFNELIIVLGEKWCVETSSFVFGFGEATITLEDVMILGGFSVLGECVRKTRVLSSEVEEIREQLMVFFENNGSNYVQHCEWIEHFVGFGGELEHVAFLVLWLSRYVFPTQCCDGYICSHVFSIALSLVRGTRIALAPAVLASIYKDFGFLKAIITNFVSEGSKDDGSKVVLWAPFQLVQLWVWERFTILSPKPGTCLRGEPRLARWKKPRKTSVRLVRFEFDSLGECFLWRPYALYVTDREFAEFYCDEGKLVSMNSEVSDELLSFAKCLRPCELVGLDCIEQYLPHRVAMQFGMDQDVPCHVSRCNESVELAWSSYNKPFNGEVLYLPPRLHRGEVTSRYLEWWRTEFLSLKTRNRRRSKRIAQIRSRKFNVDSGKHGTRAMVCLSSSSEVSTKPSFVDGGEGIPIEIASSPDKNPTDCENGPSQNVTTKDCTEMAPCTSNLVSSVDDMRIDFDKSIPDCENLSQNVDKSFGMHIETGSSSHKIPTNCEIVLFENIREDDCTDMAPCTTNLVSSVDEICMDVTPSLDKSVLECENLSQHVDNGADDMNKSEAPRFLSLCYTTANAEPGKVANIDTSITRMSNVVDDPIVIFDEEVENGDLNRFLAKCLAFVSRISMLEEEYLVVEAAVAKKTL